MPRAFSRRPSEEVVIPFPRPEITPPLTTKTFTDERPARSYRVRA